jgi:hypothetical protein
VKVAGKTAIITIKTIRIAAGEIAVTAELRRRNTGGFRASALVSTRERTVITEMTAI